LRRALQRELAMVDAAREPGRHFGHGIFAIDGDEIGKRSKQRGLQAVETGTITCLAASKADRVN
jgi:hypothetical protein